MAMIKPGVYLVQSDQVGVQIIEWSDGYWEVNLYLKDLAHGGQTKMMDIASGYGPIDQRQRETITQRCAMVVSAALSLTGEGEPF